MDDPNSLTLDSFEQELVALNIPADDRAHILGAVRAKAQEAASERTGAAGDEEQLNVARRIQHLRMRGNEILGADIMRDPKYEMLIELYIAHHEHRRVSVSELCAATTAPQTTGLRHIEALERQGFVNRSDDSMDARRCWILPTRRALSAIDRYLEEARRVN